LDYLTVTGSTANATDTWFAGQHSTDGGGNTAWIFDDPAITVETISDTGITMNAAGVTGGTLTGNVTTLLDGTPRIPVHAEVGLTAAYGTNVTGGTIYDNGLFTVSVPVNQTPGETYHYRMVGETGNGTSPFEGADGDYVYTQPARTTEPSTNVVMNAAGTTATLNTNISNMGVASTSTLFIEWGYNIAYGNTIGSRTINAIGDYSSILTGFDPNQTVHYRVAVTNGAVTVYGADEIAKANETPQYGMLMLIPIIVLAALLLVMIGLIVSDINGILKIILIAIVVIMVINQIPGIMNSINGVW
jgi:hypothetical protein